MVYFNGQASALVHVKTFAGRVGGDRGVALVAGADIGDGGAALGGGGGVGALVA